MKLPTKKYIHKAFTVGVAVKGVDGVLETVTGSALLFLNPAHANAVFLLASYLLTHGIVKIVLVAGLLRNRLWAYPAAIAVFTLFGLYQIYYLLQAYSVWLLALTLLDAAVILLTWHEWEYRKPSGLVEEVAEGLK